ncbi:Formamidopyrimidine-DNA glycosylase (EC [Bathymodiolus thermophilus thioautotrophic gill symbiont]|jgi:formamidopyrimidine-DNA glycosylase|uniref:Formamidopyrimidine-DNA glycosylase n=3 Tax=sulfur-oxidizing symbionts TaxID=32036 RepID=A0A1H6JL40_9GAMM|nr:MULTISPECIES: bifunctional DNA-formamidopyrimidine glycosylase/DNA-(apurinic or apyrimidinic site) lyase [sulfur-oxidizing symbionts]CAC9512460.1 Formamidopyrimidine-DNA glycosylase (EC 3.2.2.23) [uncultured Gammaproteobacteria bacterium]CAB5495029.1 Formamidopyrimidine-DNA glycosylase (EC [Bathymodiolus azoricus thioautotrophic gill symbiont]CAB5496656.1 Formamidopyrimidine-DNA glycosylase (EC [Bathymodiolus thermophilus thioautotrophic gill symbiont]CAC9983704.1 Formamidopyrimidine-DNA gly
MPELPEVETTKLGLEPLIVNQTVERAYLHRANLRWDMPKHLVTTLSNQSVNKIQRRGKYLLIKFDVGTLIIHLGMSGSIKVVDNDTPLEKHDHFELVFMNRKRLRLNDPRRFGAVLFSENGSHPLLDNLGVEPLEGLFDNEYLYTRSHKKQQNIKAFIMDSKVVVGVGNIYACESLHQAGISPERKAGSVGKKCYALLTQCIKNILTQAIKAGGTTLQDFSAVDGKPGYFSQTLSVYGRENENCMQCDSKITRIIQNQRSTFYCRKCQT